jgi:hypothetical protein
LPSGAPPPSSAVKSRPTRPRRQSTDSLATGRLRAAHDSLDCAVRGLCEPGALPRPAVGACRYRAARDAWKLAVRRSSQPAVRTPSSAVRDLSSLAVRDLSSSAVRGPSSSSVRGLPSSVLHHPSSVLHHPSSVPHAPPSPVHHRFLTAVLRGRERTVLDWPSPVRGGGTTASDGARSLAIHDRSCHALRGSPSPEARPWVPPRDHHLDADRPCQRPAMRGARHYPMCRDLASHGPAWPRPRERKPAGASNR